MGILSADAAEAEDSSDLAQMAAEDMQSALPWARKTSTYSPPYSACCLRPKKADPLTCELKAYVHPAGHAGDEADECAKADEVTAEDTDSGASSGEDTENLDEHRTIDLPRPLPETDAEDAAAGQEASTSGRMRMDGSHAALSPDLITLALLPRSQWQGLVHLDAIKVSKSTGSLQIRAFKRALSSTKHCSSFIRWMPRICLGYA